MNQVVIVKLVSNVISIFFFQLAGISWICHLMLGTISIIKEKEPGAWLFSVHWIKFYQKIICFFWSIYWLCNWLFRPTTKKSPQCSETTNLTPSLQGGPEMQAVSSQAVLLMYLWVSVWLLGSCMIGLLNWEWLPCHWRPILRTSCLHNSHLHMSFITSVVYIDGCQKVPIENTVLSI